MFVVRCIPEESFLIRVMYLVTYNTHTCGMVELSGTMILVHVPSFTVLIESNVQLIDYYLFANILINADKIIELSE